VESSKDHASKLSASSKAFAKTEADKAKLAKTGRVFKPKSNPKEEDKSSTKLAFKGRTFKPKEGVNSYFNLKVFISYKSLMSKFDELKICI
jgi:hypothetical protein